MFVSEGFGMKITVRVHCWLAFCLVLVAFSATARRDDEFAPTREAPVESAPDTESPTLNLQSSFNRRIKELNKRIVDYYQDKRAGKHPNVEESLKAMQKVVGYIKYAITNNDGFRADGNFGGKSPQSAQRYEKDFPRLSLPIITLAKEIANNGGEADDFAQKVMKLLVANDGTGLVDAKDLVVVNDTMIYPTDGREESPVYIKMPILQIASIDNAAMVVPFIAHIMKQGGSMDQQTVGFVRDGNSYTARNAAAGENNFLWVSFERSYKPLEDALVPGVSDKTNGSQALPNLKTVMELIGGNKNHKLKDLLEEIKKTTGETLFQNNVCAAHVNVVIDRAKSKRNDWINKGNSLCAEAWDRATSNHDQKMLALLDQQKREWQQAYAYAEDNYLKPDIQYLEELSKKCAVRDDFLRRQRNVFKIGQLSGDIKKNIAAAELYLRVPLCNPKLPAAQRSAQLAQKNIPTHVTQVPVELRMSVSPRMSSAEPSGSITRTNQPFKFYRQDDRVIASTNNLNALQVRSWYRSVIYPCGTVLKQPASSCKGKGN